MPNEVNTGKKLKLIETDDINKVPFEQGQYIIVDDGMVYYDPTFGVTLDDRICLTPKQEIDVYVRSNNYTNEYYLALHTRPINGDIVIIKDLIPNTNKYIYTIYIYNDNPEDTNPSDWVKLTGQYRADDIYFDKDVTLTIDLPGHTLVDGKKTIPGVGKNLTEIFDSIFAPEKMPKIVPPSIEVKLNEAGKYQIGTVVTPTYEVVFNPGSYEFGPDTEVKLNSVRVVSSTGTTKSTTSGSFSAITITPDTNFYIEVTVTHSSGTIPMTVKGHNYAEGQIKAGTIKVKSAAISGFTTSLYYGCKTTVIKPSDITSDFIKSLNSTATEPDTNTVNMVVPVNTRSIILACPESSGGLEKIYNETVNADMLEAFGAPTIVKVAGADNKLSSNYAKNYLVYIYSPAEPYEIKANLKVYLMSIDELARTTSVVGKAVVGHAVVNR